MTFINFIVAFVFVVQLVTAQEINATTEARCIQQGLKLFGQPCTTTAQCCDFGGGALPFCSPVSRLCQWCPNAGGKCVGNTDCCPGNAARALEGKSYCNTTLGFCIGCKDRGDPCFLEYDNCCRRPGLVCRYSATAGWNVCF